VLDDPEVKVVLVELVEVVEEDVEGVILASVIVTITVSQATFPD
jgi:hypothetical protein